MRQNSTEVLRRFLEARGPDRGLADPRLTRENECRRPLQNVAQKRPDRPVLFAAPDQRDGHLM
jgi:hypothetical protein